MSHASTKAGKVLPTPFPIATYLATAIPVVISSQGQSKQGQNCTYATPIAALEIVAIVGYDGILSHRVSADKFRANKQVCSTHTCTRSRRNQRT